MLLLRRKRTGRRSRHRGSWPGTQRNRHREPGRDNQQKGSMAARGQESHPCQLSESDGAPVTLGNAHAARRVKGVGAIPGGLKRPAARPGWGRSEAVRAVLSRASGFWRRGSLQRAAHRPGSRRRAGGGPRPWPPEPGWRASGRGAEPGRPCSHGRQALLGTSAPQTREGKEENDKGSRPADQPTSGVRKRRKSKKTHGLRKGGAAGRLVSGPRAAAAPPLPGRHHAVPGPSVSLPRDLKDPSPGSSLAPARPERPE